MFACVDKTSRLSYTRHLLVSVLLLLAVIDTSSSTLTISHTNLRQVIQNSTTKTVEPRPPPPYNASDYRLPPFLFPLYYEVTLHPKMEGPDPDKFTFKGSVMIKLRCYSATSNITLHASGLNLNRSSFKFEALRSSEDEPPTFDNFVVDTARQFLIIQLDKDMQPQHEYLIYVSFTAPLRSEPAGLFYTEYVKDGQNVYVAATHFEPTYARKAFPCFDEPTVKANFKITLIRPEDKISVSNTRMESSSETFTEDGTVYVKDVFAETTTISAYRLAFVIGDFNLTFARGKIDLEPSISYNLKTWVRQRYEEHAAYSVDITMQLLEFFGKYFDDYSPLAKQEMIAVPNLTFTAVPNSGLIVFREPNMLYNQDTSAEVIKESVTSTISSTLVHQWFADSLTPEWWDDVALNKGLVSFMAYMGVGFVLPKSETYQMFIIDKLHPALEFDSGAQTRPLLIDLNKPDDIPMTLDEVSDKKGASVFRMLHFLLGDDTFQKGIANYLKVKRSETAGLGDLWKYMTEQAKSEGQDIDVQDIMDAWLLQSNYPVVTVTRDFNNPDLIEVTQERFLEHWSETDFSACVIVPSRYRWDIPLTLTTSEDPLFDGCTFRDIKWLSKSDHMHVFSMSTSSSPTCPSHDSWILANVQQYGYYRVNYDNGNWKALSRQLKSNHAVIPPINRAQIINDAWSLSKAGYVQLETALATIEYLDKERDYIPWHTAIKELNYVAAMLDGTSLFEKFKTFMARLLHDPFIHFGFTQSFTSHLDKLTQSLVILEACKYDVGSCYNESYAKFKQFRQHSDVNMIDPNFRASIYCIIRARSTGHMDDWEFITHEYMNDVDEEEKDRLLYGISCTTNDWFINNFVGKALGGTLSLLNGHAFRCLSALANKANASVTVWNNYRSHYRQLCALSDEFECRNALPKITRIFNTQNQLTEVKNFINETCHGFLDNQAGKAVIANIERNIKWLETNTPILTTWLNRHVTDSSG